MMRIAVVVAALSVLAACAPAEAPKPSTPAPVATAPPPSTAAPTPSPVAEAPSGPDQCGARALQGLVGKPRSEIPIPVDPSKRRVACTTCAVTMDFREDRLNILFDADTGVIKEVKCG